MQAAHYSELKQKHTPKKKIKKISQQNFAAKFILKSIPTQQQQQQQQ